MYDTLPEGFLSDRHELLGMEKTAQIHIEDTLFVCKLSKGEGCINIRIPLADDVCDEAIDALVGEYGK